MIPTSMRRLLEPVEHLLQELAKFGVIGAVAFAATVAMANLFHFGLGLGPLTSFALATAISAVASYFANRHWTWRDKENSGVRRELSLFMVLSAIGLGISEIPVVISEYLLHQHSALAYNLSSTLFGTVFGTIWRFWSFRRWVFLESEPARSEDAVHEALV